MHSETSVKDVGFMRIRHHLITCSRCDALIYHDSHIEDITDDTPVPNCRSHYLTFSNHD